MQFPERPTVYLDVSLMMGNRRNTGIQRVVRNLASVAPQVCSEFKYNCRLVQCLSGKFYRLRYDLIDTQSTSFVSRMARRGIGKKILGQTIPRFSSELTPLSMDRLITINGTWDQPDWLDAVEDMTQQCHVSSVVHDLIPLTHPQFHTGELCRRFKKWFHRLVRTVHNVVATSTTGRNEIESWLQQNLAADERRPRVSQFRLTSELSAAPSLGLISADEHFETDAMIRPELRHFIQDDRPTVLAVGTIEPRKNHLQLLDACQQLWSQKWKGRLLLLGARGWDCEEILTRIHEIPRERLLHLADASDSELNYAYQNSQLLVFPSTTEGFGLPIVEALERGLPVLVSDTPIHREVASTHAEYFPLSNVQGLATLLQHCCFNLEQSKERTKGFRSTTCFESFHSLVCDSIVAGRGFKAQIENTPPWLNESRRNDRKSA